MPGIASRTYSWRGGLCPRPQAEPVKPSSVCQAKRSRSRSVTIECSPPAHIYTLVLQWIKSVGSLKGLLSPPRKHATDTQHHYRTILLRFATFSCSSVLDSADHCCLARVLFLAHSCTHIHRDILRPPGNNNVLVSCCTWVLVALNSSRAALLLHDCGGAKRILEEAQAL